MNQLPTIQWFPGHMTKTRRIIEEHLKYIDVVIEILDSRAPIASHNPFLQELLKHKPKLILLNKQDLADPSITDKWLQYYKKEDTVLDVWKIEAKQIHNKTNLIHRIKKVFEDNKWYTYRPVRALVIGTPNVGKSTFINALIGKAKAKVENRPGVTQQLARYTVDTKLELFDSPGMLWHKFTQPHIGLKLALMGNIREAILPQYEIALWGIGYLLYYYPDQLISHYPFKLDAETHENFYIFCRHILPPSKSGEIDENEGARRFLRELQSGRLGKISWEEPEHKRIAFFQGIPELESNLINEEASGSNPFHENDIVISHEPSVKKKKKSPPPSSQKKTHESKKDRKQIKHKKRYSR